MDMVKIQGHGTPIPAAHGGNLPGVHVARASPFRRSPGGPRCQPWSCHDPSANRDGDRLAAAFRSMCRAGRNRAPAGRNVDGSATSGDGMCA